MARTPGGTDAFAAAVDSWSQALAAYFGGCGCTHAADGYYQQQAVSCQSGVPGRCRTVTHAAIRAHLARLRMPVDHVTDLELPSAVADLSTALVGGLEDEQLVAAIHRALHAERLPA